MVPTPSIKPASSNNVGDVLGRIGNFGLGIFDRIIDRENVQAELALAQRRFIAEERRAAETQAVKEPASAPSIGIDNNTLLLGGAALIAALLISRL